MPDANDPLGINKALTNQTQFEAAKYGGTGSGLAAKAGGLLGLLLSGYQAAYPHAPAANLANGMYQAYNVQKYNRAINDAQQRELKRQNDKRQAYGSYYNAMGVPILQNQQGQNIYLDPEDYKQVGELNGNAQAIQGDAALSRGQSPNYGMLTPAAHSQQMIGEHILKPAVESNQNGSFYQQMGQQNPYGANGQQPPVMQQAPSAPSQNLQPGQPQNGTLDLPKTLQAGARQTAPPPEPPPAPLSPMQMFTSGQYNAKPSDITSAMSQRETARNNQMTLTEAKRYHDQMIAQNKAELQARIDHGYWSPNSPPAPRAFNLNEAMWNSMSPQQRQQWMQTQTTDPAKAAPPDPQFEALAKQAQLTTQAYGAGSKEAKQAADAVANYQNNKPLMNLPQVPPNMLFNNPASQFMNSLPGGLPYRGQSAAKTKHSGNLGAQYGVHY